jgi:DNA oxidative demethylase
MLFTCSPIELETDVWLLPGFASQTPLLEGIDAVTASAPFRHLIVPSGKRMAVAMSNCGSLGWTSDRSGYRHTKMARS